VGRTYRVEFLGKRQTELESFDQIQESTLMFDTFDVTNPIPRYYVELDLVSIRENTKHLVSGFDSLDS
jgi:hypothetical protein